MKKNDIFSVPQRQSQFAIIFIILRFVRRIISQLWPILIAIILGRGGSSFDNFELALSGIGIFGVIPSVIAYYKFYFYLSEKELIINKGLFKKVKLNIPFERIQSVNFRQTFVHQFFKVTEVEIETAGSAEQETKIDAIDIPTAEKLRKRILERRAEALQNEVQGPSTSIIAEESKESILKLSRTELLRVGLAQNHLQPIGLLSGVIGSLIFYSFTFDYDPRDFFNEIYGFIEGLAVVRIALLVVVLLAGSVLYSIITTVLRHYNLHFWRSGQKFQVVQGLLTRQEFAALDNKIQILNWGQNPFERLIGFYNVVFRQAKSSEQGKRQSQFKIPGCNSEHISFVKNAWLGSDSGEFVTYEKVSIHYFLHPAFYQIVIFGIPIFGLFYFDMPQRAMLIVIFLILSLGLNWLNYKKKKFALNSKELYIGGGTLGLRHSLLPMYKVQNVNISENPYQWRRKLATLVIHTAAGSVSIPYIPRGKAVKLMDMLVYQIESSNKPWI